MTAPRLFVLHTDVIRNRCMDHIASVPEGFEVLVTPPRMNEGQKSRFHSICSEFKRSGIEWAGKFRTGAEWKVLLISGHAVATHQEAEVVKGLEGELVNVRESITSMSKARGASLIEYAQAAAEMYGVQLRK